MNWILSRIIGNPLLILYITGLCFAAGFASGGALAWKYQGLRLDAEKVRFDAFVKETALIGELATKTAKDKEIKNAEITQSIQQDYLAERSMLFDRLQHANTRGRTLPEFAIDPGSAVTADRERGRTCEGTQFYSNALDCELKLAGIRTWVHEQKIPVH